MLAKGEEQRLLELSQDLSQQSPGLRFVTSPTLWAGDSRGITLTVKMGFLVLG